MDGSSEVQDCGILWSFLWAFLILFILYLVYDYYKMLTWSSLPGPFPLPIFGSFLKFLMDSAAKGALREEEGVKKYGKVYRSWMGRFPVILVNDPEILKKIFVKNFEQFRNRGVIKGGDPWPINKGVFFLRDDDWKRVRSILTPTFSSGKLKLMVPEMNRCAVSLTDSLVKKAEAKETVPIKDHTGGFSMDVIASTAFGIQTDSLNNPDEPFVKLAQKVFGRDQLKSMAVILMIFFPKWIPLLVRLGLTSFWPQDSVDFFKETATQILESRKEGNEPKRRDFMQLMIDARMDDEDEDKTEEGAESAAAGDPDTGKVRKHLDFGEILGQAFLFFIAGYDTTATMLQYTYYCLALHPEIQDQLVEEIQSYVGDGEPTYEIVQEMPYLDQVVNESLRLYPPLSRMNRTVSSDKDVTVGGYTFPKGAHIQYSIWYLHHNPEYYPDPMEFRPERFSPENKKGIDPLTFIPFGYGPRICMGMRLAYLESKIALVHTLRKVRFVPCKETEIPLTLNHHEAFTKTKTPIKLGVELRS